MPEPVTLTTLLLAGAAAASTETVKEATKDAYRTLKDKVGELFGPRAAKAIAKLNNASTQEEGGKNLSGILGTSSIPTRQPRLSFLSTRSSAH